MQSQSRSEALIPLETSSEHDARENPLSDFKGAAQGQQQGGSNITTNRCGVFGCYPSSIQRLATPRIFFLCFCLQNVLIGMMTSYMIATQTSVERHFQLSAKSMGLYLTLGQIGPILTSLFLAYCATKGNRPRWMCGSLCTLGAAMLFSFSLHLIFPPPNLQSGPNPFHESLTGNRSRYTDLCEASDGTLKEEECTVDWVRQKLGFACWLLVYIMMGIGTTTMYAVSCSYLDDSVPQKDSPLYFGLNMAIRIIGPLCGAFLGSACVKLYVKLNYNPGLAPNDPRWIGAWWFGYIFLSIMFFTLAAIFASFPKEMIQNATRKEKRVSLQPSTRQINYRTCDPDDTEEVRVIPSKLNDLKQTILRVARNPVLVCLCLDDVCGILGSVGFGIWLPKFLENEYRMSRSKASLVAGITNNASMIIGLLSFASWIRNRKPKARTVALVTSGAKILYVVGLVLLMFMGCGYDGDLPGKLQPDGSLQLHTNCSQECQGGCATARFIPVCHENRNSSQTFFSPCFAGCASQENSTAGISYTGCKCISFNDAEDPASHVVKSGYCNNRPCSKFYAYMAIFAVMRLLLATSPVGSTMIKLRCVDPQDKTMALGLMSFLTALLGFVPNPIIYGSVIDSSCLVWEESCGDRGACWAYNLTDFRYNLHGLAIVFTFLAACCQFVTFLKAGNLDIIREEDGEETHDLTAQ